METNISCNGGKGVMNCIMGSSAFVAMSTTYEVQIFYGMRNKINKGFYEAGRWKCAS